MECNECGAELDFREAFCSKCGELTDRGKGPGELAGRYVAKLSDGFRKLIAAALGYVTNPENRTKVGVSTGAALLLLISLTDNPISRGVGSIFTSTPNAPTLNDDGTPNFADFEDVFVGEEAQFLVTGTANVRDFPTSQETRVQRSLSEGQTVTAREVAAFDPASQWFKLSEGGYVWGQNLFRLESEAQGVSNGIQFASNIHGKWSSMETCRGARSNAEVTIGSNTISFSESVGRLTRVDMDTNGQNIYTVEYSGFEENWTDRITVSPTANGFSIIMAWPDNPDQAGYAYHVFPVSTYGTDLRL